MLDQLIHFMVQISDPVLIFQVCAGVLLVLVAYMVIWLSAYSAMASGKGLAGGAFTRGCEYSCYSANLNMWVWFSSTVQQSPAQPSDPL